METNSVSKTYEKSEQIALFRNVYLWMSMALVITGLTSLVVADSPSILSAIFSNRFVFYVLLFGELGLVWYMSARINSLSFSTATLLFIFYSILNGVTLSVIFLIYTLSSIASTFFVTAGTFAVCHQKRFNQYR